MIPSRSCLPVTVSCDINIWSRDIYRIIPYLGTGFSYAYAGDGRVQSISVKQAEECGGCMLRSFLIRGVPPSQLLRLSWLPSASHGHWLNQG